MADFTYIVPDDFRKRLGQFLFDNVDKELAGRVLRCDIDYDDMGLAYYAGISGADVWDKHALDFIVEGVSEDISVLKRQEPKLRDAIQKVLKPNKSGFLLRKLECVVCESITDIDLPMSDDDTFEVLERDIKDALAKNEPVLVLDRLHTFTVKFLRKKCQNVGISISDNNGKNLPLHSLVGQLIKEYRNSGVIQSDFAASALKMSISIFEQFNDIRNDMSYAHDNKVLDKEEAKYVVSIMASTISFINEIEQKHCYDDLF